MDEHVHIAQNKQSSDAHEKRSQKHVLNRLSYVVGTQVNPLFIVCRLNVEIGASFMVIFTTTGKCESILIIISLLYSQINCERSGMKHHVISNLLPHYLAKFECSTVILFIHISHNKCQTLISL